MVTSFINDDDFAKNPKTLCDWVKNFRIKKIQMKRKLRGAGSDLRVCAILSTALLSAEHELRRKQQERFNRWLEMQAKLEQKKASSSTMEVKLKSSASDDDDDDAAEELKRREEITNLWKYELSGLDAFMRTISSSCNSIGGLNNHSVPAAVSYTYNTSPSIKVES